MVKRITYVCTDCGSKNVVTDANARWDEESQAWVVKDIFDESEGWCRDCDEKYENGDVNLKEIEL